MNYTYPTQQFVPPVNHQSYKPVQQYTWNQPIPTQQVRPVSSIEEVRASPIDFDGSVFYFPDIANKKIYTKFINMDGTVAINLYELKEITAADQQLNEAYITREEFENVINQLKLMYEESIQKLQQPMAMPQAQTQAPNFQF